MLVTDYDWNKYASEHWVNRYPAGIAGRQAWNSFHESIDRRALLDLRGAHSSPSPCVFISHRQADVKEAREAAQVARQFGFSVWLDVLDPVLMGRSGLPDSLSDEQHAMVVAATIEIALLNSSHVLAIITPNTVGSQWVPYEYGRVKARQVTSDQAACLISSGASVKLPEYLHLGATLNSRSALTTWLAEQAFQHLSSKIRGAS